MASRIETENLLARYSILVSQFTQNAQQLSLQQTDSDHGLYNSMLSWSSSASSDASDSSASSSASSIRSSTSSPPLTPSASTSFLNYPMHSHNNETYTIAEDAQTSEELMSSLTRQIKATLTSLLNVPSVKKDTEMRGWVQARLMEVEKEMRRLRRRTSAGRKTGLMFGSGRIVEAMK